MGYLNSADRLLVIAATVSLLVGSGCALQAPKRTPPSMPETFADQATAARGTWPGKDWYRAFGSSELDLLVAQAALDNLDLAAARARLAQAGARARQTGAAILPQVDAGVGADFYAGHSASGSAHETDWSALFSASYEVDFWGKNRAAVTSAKLLAAASRADRDTVALTTLAGVANEYFELLSLRERLKNMLANRDAARRLLDVVAARYEFGAANPSDLAAQRAALAAAELNLPDLRQREEEALAALALLVGRPPEGFHVDGVPLDSLTEPRVAPGLPADLLLRRPDLSMAEANLGAADADLVVARAALLPNLSLTAAGGMQNPAVQAAVVTLTGAGPTLNLGAGLIQTIFDGGRLRAVRAEVEARDEELVATYRHAILAALVDVETALAAIRHLDERREFEVENLTQSERALQAAEARYQQGAADLLAVLEAQRTLYAARDQYSQYKLARLQALVGLCKALGGGWQTETAR
jgi:NodT family efflux transporter outer membrane factor (OMF) lipoprotein